MALIITRNERTANTAENHHQLYVRLVYSCGYDGRYVSVAPAYFISKDAYKQGYAPLATDPIGASTEFFEATPTLTDIHERMISKFAGLGYDTEIADI